MLHTGPTLAIDGFKVRAGNDRREQAALGRVESLFGEILFDHFDYWILATQS